MGAVCGGAPKKQEQIKKKQSQSDATHSFGMNDAVTKKTDFFKVYNIKNKVGGGSFGEVRICQNKITLQKYAVKIIKKSYQSKEELESMIREVQILINVQHPNIVRVNEYYEEQGNLLIVMELLEGGELFDQIMLQGHFTEIRAATIMQKLLGAINYCHGQNIMHRDLKPKNIMLDNKNIDAATIKIIDFGTSIFFKPQQYENSKIGTPYFVAPEVLNGKYNEKCDIWSLGVICYLLLCGQTPFNGNSLDQLLNNVKRGRVTFEQAEFQKVSQQAKDFIKKLLIVDYEKRPSAKEALSDPWIVQNAEVIEDKNAIKLSVQNLYSYNIQMKIQEAAWSCINAYLTTKEDTAKLIQAFQQLDKNHDGFLTAEELLASNDLKILLDSHDPEQELQNLVSKIDKDNNGKIDFNEFLLVAQDRQKMLTKEKMKKTFQLFDKDGNGQISLKEFKAMFCGEGDNSIGQGKQLTQEEWKNIFKDADQDGDGQISLYEFEKMLEPLLQTRNHPALN